MQKKLLIVAFILGAVASGYSQVGIGTQTPNESSQLDIVSNSKGVLIPRISLTSHTDQTTITGGNVNSLLVFNTNNTIGSGYYYWMSDKWLRIINAQDLESLPHNNTVNTLLSVDQLDHKLKLQDSDGHIVEVPLSEIFKDQEFVKAITEMHFEEIFNHQNVINKIIQTLVGTYGNVSYNPSTNKFQYYNGQGVLTDIDWTDFNTTNQSFTIVGADLVITDTAGDTVEVALKTIFDHADFVKAITETHVEEIFNNQNVINKIINTLNGAYGNVSYNSLTNKFYYNEAGLLVEIDFSDLNTTNQSFTIVGADLVITDSAGDTVKVALADIFEHSDFVTAITEVHIKDIFNHPTVMWQIAYNLRKEYGNVIYNTTTNQFEYLDGNGNAVIIDWSDMNTTNESFTVQGLNLVIKDTAGHTVELALKTIFEHVDLITAITETHLTSIFNNPDVVNTIVTNLKDKYGNVVYNATTNVFQYYNEFGVLTDIDLENFKNTKNASLVVDDNSKELVLHDTDGGQVKVALSKLNFSRPWNKLGGTEEAQTYLQDIYQQGRVAVGTRDIPSLTIGGVLQDVKFHVDGNITTTGKLYTTSSVYADYVFEKYFTGYSDLRPAYEFKSLDDVKDFIEKNNHLPGVTKIADLSTSENGYTIDMTALSIQQLEKIEELYLHTIEQQGLIDKLSEEIKQLRSESDLVKDRLSQLEDLLSKASI